MTLLAAAEALLAKLYAPENEQWAYRYLKEREALRDAVSAALATPDVGET